VTPVTGLLVAVLLFFVGFGFAVVPPILDQGSQFAHRAPGYVRDLQQNHRVASLDARYHFLGKLKAYVDKPERLGGKETILVCEDDDHVRSFIEAILTEHGYTVLAAASPNGALGVVAARRAGPLDVLVSDVVMPQMSGPALAKRLLLLRPEMKVLCLSGYTDDTAIRHGVIMGEFAFLQKPLTVETLTRKVRDVLDAAVPALSR